MKPTSQNLRFSIQGILLALLCFAKAPSAIAAEHYSDQITTDTLHQRADHQKIDVIKLADNATSQADHASDNSESAADKEAKKQAKRQKMIEYCEANRGTDCERAVDTELEAQDLEIVHTSPPDPLDRVPPRPRPRPRAR